ncbi:sigma-70 family RNA polymerase sigma factor [Peptoniphilus sp. AGMB00490]|uniref:Sigma-70 family RNA polymerase sigma factor n=2 Tax=Peptoniphilus TaxID=162289 RepID=A0ACD6AZC9_9FIRM|nr:MULTISPECIES: sigma-70 family RNA polymerase sigma factor [Peptoniphilus]NMW85411.1 sigma-70 family RNA polymerase sigma factor [Peptoniphilus faecalis]OLR64766.1 RNA polymerase subunit sigma-70 [Peptoniphilus porci]
MMNDYKDFNRVLRSALVGEERSKVKLLDMLDPLIRSSIKRYCPVFNEFEDLYSDGRAIVLSCIESFDNKRSFLRYVESYLRYYYLDTYKYLLKVNSDVHEGVTYDEEESLNIFDSIDAGVDIEGDYLEGERLGILKKAMDSLTPRQETVVRLFFYEGFGLSEIANFLGISKWTVINLKRNAINNMRNFISCYYK